MNKQIINVIIRIPNDDVVAKEKRKTLQTASKRRKAK